MKSTCVPFSNFIQQLRVLAMIIALARYMLPYPEYCLVCKPLYNGWLDNPSLPAIYITSDSYISSRFQLAPNELTFPLIIAYFDAFLSHENHPCEIQSVDPSVKQNGCPKYWHGWVSTSHIKIVTNNASDFRINHFICSTVVCCSPCVCRLLPEEKVWLGRLLLLHSHGWSFIQKSFS